MNKTEFINVVNSKTGLTKKECRLCLDVIIEVIKDALKSGETVTLSNFGKFSTNNIKQKNMYNFQTGLTEIVGERRTPKFKPSENLKQSIK